MSRHIAVIRHQRPSAPRCTRSRPDSNVVLNRAREHRKPRLEENYHTLRCSLRSISCFFFAENFSNLRNLSCMKLSCALFRSDVFFCWKWVLLVVPMFDARESTTALADVTTSCDAPKSTVFSKNGKLLRISPSPLHFCDRIMVESCRDGLTAERWWRDRSGPF